MTTKQNKKINIPKALKIAVWNKYIGEDIGKTKCLCCNITDITQLKFHTGHIISEFNGGLINIDNLKPICESCNKSMSKKNMNDFIMILRSKETNNNTLIVKQSTIKKNNELTNKELYTCRRIDSELKLAVALRVKLPLLKEEDKILYKRYCDSNKLLSEFSSISSKNLDNGLSKFPFPSDLSKNIDNELSRFSFPSDFLGKKYL